MCAHTTGRAPVEVACIREIMGESVGESLGASHNPIWTIEPGTHLQPPRAEMEQMSSQYLCGASIPDSQHIMVKVEVSNPTRRSF